MNNTSVTGPAPADDDADLLRYIVLRQEPFATARDIEPHTTVGYKQTRNRLDDLVESGYLYVEIVGGEGGTKVYWPTDKGRQYLADRS